MLSTLHTLFPYLIRYRWRYAAGLSALTLKNVFAAAVPLLLRFVIDEANRGAGLRILSQLAGALLGVALLKAFFQYWMRWILIGISRDIEYDLRSDLFGHLVSLPQRFYQAYRTGDLMSRATNDMNAVRLMLGPGIMYTADVLLTFAVVLAVMSSTDWRLTCLVFIPIPLVSFTVSYFGRQTHERFRSVQEKFSDLSSHVQESLSSIRIVRAYAQSKAEVERFQETNQQYVGESLKLIAVWTRFYPIMEFLIGLTYLIVMWYGGRKVIEGEITVGAFVMFMTYMAILTWPMIGLGWVVNVVQRGAASLERLNELLAQRPEIADSEQTDYSISEIRGDIELRNVTVFYPGGETPVLDGVSLYVPAGQTLAIVGPTGSGKSTLVNLIPRLLDPQRGSVLIDGVDVRRIPLVVLRRSIGMVPQETFLFSRSLADNIAFGAPDAEAWQVFEASQIAQLAPDIDGFGNGYETLVGERGITLSGGQKQRTAIARAVLRDPRILILDDALASVDTVTEENVLEQLRINMRNRTSLLISHRVSTARNADRIVVLIDGRVTEAGRHEELLERGGHYYELHQKQLLEEELERV
jgi:ATP-binding cassette subfamily B protein